MELRFKENENSSRMLKNIQDALFEALVRWLYKVCKSEYLKAIDFAGIETSLSNEIRCCYPENFHSLREAYGIIAQYFRYLHQESGQLIFPVLICNCEKLSPAEATKIHYIREWSEFWYEETRKLSQNREIVLAVLKAHVYQDVSKIKYQKILKELLIDRYCTCYSIMPER
jgi:hypothetical protein